MTRKVPKVHESQYIYLDSKRLGSFLYFAKPVEISADQMPQINQGGNKYTTKVWSIKIRTIPKLS